MRNEMRFCGFGGQGIILLGRIVGEAAALYDHHEATLTQSYGPESRGGACSTQLIVADETIHFPHITSPRVIVAMSLEAYNKFHNELAPGGLLIVDEDLVKLDPDAQQRVLQVPATRLAEKMGRKIVANIVMLGALGALTDIVSADALREAMLNNIPPATRELNLKAFDLGYEYARELLAGQDG